MSTTDRPDRETAYRLFAAEFDDASLSYAESDEERAPNYVVTPTGARVNRLFVVGVLTEIEAVNDTQLRARIVDPTGAFVVYAGQYQPEALSFLESATPPAFVAVTGKARTFQPEDSDRVFTSVRPETLSEVDASTRDRFVVGTAERTLERVETARDALARAERDDDLREALEGEGVDVGLAAGVPRAIAHYGTTSEYLDAVEEMAREAAAMVAGEREDVAPLTVEPGSGPVDSPDRTTDGPTSETSAVDSSAVGSETESGSEVEADDEGPAAGDEDESSAGSEPSAEPESSPEPVAESASTADSDGSIDEPTAESETSAPEPDIEEPPVETDEAAETGDPSEPDPTDEDGEDGVTAETPDSGESVGSEGSDTRTDPSEESESPEERDSPEESAVEADLDDPEEFELDDEVRERIEAEYGTEFESAATVDDPGEADIETPTPDDEPDESAAADSEVETEDETAGDTAVDVEAGTDDGSDAEPAEAGAETEPPTEADASADVDAIAEDETDEAGAGAVDPEDAVVSAMEELDDGDGAEREAVVERVGEEYGLTPAEADDGIQSALMSGACYEPDDETLKAI